MQTLRGRVVRTVGISLLALDCATARSGQPVNRPGDRCRTTRVVLLVSVLAVFFALVVRALSSARAA
jgi:hypothetical protein